MNQHLETRGAQSSHHHTDQPSPQCRGHFPCHSQKAKDLGMSSVLLPSHCRKADFKSSPGSQILSSIYNTEALRSFS